MATGEEEGDASCICAYKPLRCKSDHEYRQSILQRQAQYRVLIMVQDTEKGYDLLHHRVTQHSCLSYKLPYTYTQSNTGHSGNMLPQCLQVKSCALWWACTIIQHQVVLQFCLVLFTICHARGTICNPFSGPPIAFKRFSNPKLENKGSILLNTEEHLYNNYF